MKIMHIICHVLIIAVSYEEHDRFYPGCQKFFFSLEMTEFSGEAAKASREAASKIPQAPTDNNLTSMPTPISFDWHSQSEKKTEQTD